MHIVLDTTELFRNPMLTGTQFTLLRTFIKRNTASLAIPAVVFEEAVNHFREHLAQHVKSAQRELRAVQDLLPTAELPELEVNQTDSVAEYRKYLQERIGELGGMVVEFESVQLGALIARALERRKPFDGEGRKGFRDAIIWETILTKLVADKNRKVALITGNSKDFGKEGRLHANLQNECIEAGGLETTVILYCGLSDFIDAEVKPNLEKLDAVVDSITKQGCYKDFAIGEFLDAYPAEFEQAISDYLGWDAGRPSNERFHLHTLGDLQISKEWTHLDVWKLDEDRLGCVLEVDGTADIQCLERKVGFFPDGDETFSTERLEDFDGSIRLKFETVVVLSSETGAIEDFHVAAHEAGYGPEWGIE